MSDEPARLVASVIPDGQEERRRETPAGIWEHYCERPGCKQWGSRGFVKRGQQVWFCFEHRDDGEA
jgi:hypothetical protein